MGYPALTLRAKGRKQWTVTVHTLVAAAFIGPRPDRADIMHRDGSRTNCRADNLKYGSRRENNLDKANHGTDNRGDRNHNSKLTEEQVRRIRAGGFSDTEWAAQLGVSDATVFDARRGRTWAWVN